MRYWIEQVFMFSLVAIIMGGIVLASAHAGVLDQIVDIDPPLRKRINEMKLGIVVDDTFHVKKYCAYEIKLRVIHKNKMMDEYGLWDRYRADKKTYPYKSIWRFQE
jgi:glycogen synthase